MSSIKKVTWAAVLALLTWAAERGLISGAQAEQPVQPAVPVQSVDDREEQSEPDIVATWLESDRVKQDCKRMKELIVLMDNDKYETRAKATDEYALIAGQYLPLINPLPATLKNIMNPKRSDVVLEQSRRMEKPYEPYADASRYAPTRIPLAKDSDAEAVLNGLARQTGLQFRFANPADKAKLANVEWDPKRNRFTDIICTVNKCTRTRAVRSAIKHNELVFESQEDVPHTFTIDKTGMFLGTITPGQDSDRQFKRPHLDLLADPQCAFTELRSAFMLDGKTTRDKETMTVGIQTAHNPRWEPFDIKRPQRFAYVSSDWRSLKHRDKQDAVGINVGVLRNRQRFTLPLDKKKTLQIHQHTLSAHYDADTGNTIVRVESCPGDVRSVFWLEAAMLTKEFELEDKQGQPLPTAVLSVRTTPGEQPIVYTVRLRSAQPPAAVAVHAYAECDRQTRMTRIVMPLGEQ